MRTYHAPRFDRGDVFVWYGDAIYTVLYIDYETHHYIYTGPNGSQHCGVEFIDKYAKVLE